MNQFVRIVFDHFELGMIHAESFSPQPWLAEHDQLLVGRDHFLNVMQIEPAKNELLAERVRIRLLQRGLKNPSAAKPPERSLDHLAGETHRFVAFLARKLRELMAVFVASQKVGQQIFHGCDAEAPERQKFRTRNPLQFFQRLRDFHQAFGVDSLTASTRISRRVWPSYSSGRTRNATSQG